VSLGRIREQSENFSACLLGLVESFKFDQNAAQIGVRPPEVRLKANGLAKLLFGIGVVLLPEQYDSQCQVSLGRIREQSENFSARLLGFIESVKLDQQAAQIGICPPEVRLKPNGLAKLLFGVGVVLLEQYYSQCQVTLGRIREQSESFSACLLGFIESFKLDQ